MKRKVVNGILIAVMIALVALTFSACNLVGAILDSLKPDAPKVTSVDIGIGSGLTMDDYGNYVATTGEEISLFAVVNADTPGSAPENVEYKWYLTVDSTTTQIGDSYILSYVFEEYTTKAYEIGVTANGVECASNITVTLKYSSNILDSTLTSSTHQIIDGAIQEYIDDLSQVDFVVDWNKNVLPNDALVDIAWTVGGNPTVVSDEESFSFTPTAVGAYTIGVTLSYKDSVVKHSVTIIVIEGYSAVASVDISLESGASYTIGRGEMLQYFQLVTSENREDITLSLSTAPVGETDYNAPIKWIVRDRNGERVLSETGRLVTINPQYGETIVKAVVDNVESKNLVIFAFTEADKQRYEQYMTSTFVWEDGVENSYITDQTDLNRLVQYAFSTRKTYVSGSGVKENGFPFATASTFDFIAEGNDQPLLDTLDTVDESGLISINRSWSENEVTGERSDYVLYVTDSSKFMAPEANYSPAENVKQEESALLHYEKLGYGEKRTSLPIDDNPEYPEPIKNSQMLYRVLGWGYKPKFDNSQDGKKMKALYEKIRQVALDYMTDEMSDYTKTLIIYEWIAQTVDYDYAIVDAPLEEHESLKYNAFSLEGVFTNADGEGYGQAVCDGRAKAFVALCGVEDIKAVRVTGNSQVNGVKERHAWNKVLIDVNGDGKKEWFMCDTTWSDRSSAGDRTERLNKQYFLVTDAYIANTHFADETSPNPVCNTIYDYYANTIVDNGEEDFDLFIDKKNVNGSKELDVAVNYAKDNGMMLEIKVATTVCNTVNGLRLLIAGYTKSSDFDIYTVASATGYNIYIIIFD